ncbi:MAG: hypothetical protein B7X99_18885 [Rhizobiales bacterium 17-65-6]|nr:MAG: hypothetical protein B7X99_18885 [Rhizobiales bacterium 17-65-6]
MLGAAMASKETNRFPTEVRARAVPLGRHHEAEQPSSRTAIVWMAATNGCSAIAATLDAVWGGMPALHLASRSGTF